MSQYNGSGTGSSSLTENKFPPFSELIEEYCDRNPKERTKFICPECGGGNLSVNMKTGKFNCMSEQSADHRQAICNALNGLYKAEHPELSNGSNGRNGGKPKTARQEFAAKAKAAEFDAEMGRSAVEMKVEELSHQFDPSTKRGTLAALTVEIAAWAKAGGHDVFATKMMLKEAIERVVGNTGVDSTHGTNTGQNASGDGVSGSGVLSVATDKEKDQFSLLQEMQSTTFDPAMMLPSTLATDVKRDAQLLAIDSVAIWVYLLPAVASLMGKISIDFSGWSVPNIIWSAIAQKSGRGKTRAMGLVTAPLWAMEKNAEEKFQAEVKKYKEDAKRATREGEEEPEKPIREKHLFNIATPQAVVKRLGEQERGCLWARDELKGALALNQYTGGEGEGLEIILETYDGKAAQVDRVSTDDSFFVPESRLSIGGGFQPKIARKMFDPEDPQGVTARMLIATAQDVEYTRIKGHPVLGEKLTDLYDWVADTEWGNLFPTVEADDLFTTIAEYFNNAPAPNDAIDFWLKKAAGNCLRVAGVLHALECYYDQSKNKKLITRDTLMRAYYYVSLCRRWIYTIQGQMVETTAVSSLLQKILDKTQSLGGSATLPDLYRNINSIRKLAKEEGKTISELTEALCLDLQSLGLGKLVTNKKGSLEFQKTSTLNTPNDKSFAPPTFEPCVDKSEYQHTVNTQHTTKTQEKESKESPNTPIKVGDTVEILDGSLKGQQPTVTAIKEVDGETTYILSGHHTSKVKGSINFDNHELPASRIKLVSSNGKF